MISIHTLSIMRNEFRAYKSLIKERDKLIEEYETPLKSLKNELLEVEGKLSQIKSPGKSDGLGGFVQDSVDKYNHLIAKKDELKNAVDNYIKEYGNDSFEEELLKALIYDRGQYDKGYEDAMNEVKHPQPLKFEDLKEGMWIYDAPYEEIVRIKEIESNEWIFLECIKSKDLSNTFFQEGRFYPITIPNIGDKNG